MHRYIMADRTSLLDSQTFQFVPFGDKEKQYEIYVPYYFWTFPEQSEHKVVVDLKREGNRIRQAESFYRRRNNLELNGLEIKFMLGYRHVNIAYKSPKTGHFVVFELDCYPNLEFVHNGRTTGQEITSIEYNMNFMGQAHKYLNVSLERPPWGYGPNFQLIDALDCAEVRDTGSNRFSFGILHDPYMVMYHGVALNGNSYAVLLGPYAILLDDEMHFDTLVLLNGVKDLILDVGVFAHTVNPYIVKCKTMIK